MRPAITFLNIQLSNSREAAMKRAEERLANKTEAIDVKRAEFALRKALVRLDIAK